MESSCLITLRGLWGGLEKGRRGGADVRTCLLARLNAANLIRPPAARATTYRLYTILATVVITLTRDFAISHPVHEIPHPGNPLLRFPDTFTLVVTLAAAVAPINTAWTSFASSLSRPCIHHRCHCCLPFIFTLHKNLS